MRILVISDLPEFVTGGAEIQAARLIEAWLDAGHEVVCLGRRMGGNSAVLGSHSIRVHRIWTTSVLGRIGRAASYFVSLTWLFLKYRRWTQVVYTRFLGEGAATIAMLKAAGLTSQPLVATPANTGGQGDLNTMRALPMSSALVRLLDRHCDAINLIAEDMVAELRGAGFSGRNFTRIPNGVPVHPLPTKEKAYPRQFVSVGRLATQKGYDLLLQAASRGGPVVASIHFVIAGDGPERDSLATLAADVGVSDRFTWMGEAPQQEVRRLLDRATVFVLPSRYEGMSNAGLEAMERGLPLILTRCGGLDRYVTDAIGWVVPAGDVDALTQAVDAAAICNMEVLERMGTEARRLVERAFDIRVVAEQYAGLFVGLASRLVKA